jgi:hypothetical protein
MEVEHVYPPRVSIVQCSPLAQVSIAAVGSEQRRGLFDLRGGPAASPGPATIRDRTTAAWR